MDELVRLHWNADAAHPRHSSPDNRSSVDKASLPASEEHFVFRSRSDKKRIVHAVSPCLRVSLSQRSSLSYQPVAVQCDVLPGVLFAVRFHPFHMLLAFPSSGFLVN